MVVSPKAPNLVLRVIWFIVVGWWLGGILSAAAWVLNATIIGLPLGLYLINRLPTFITLRPQDQAYMVHADGTIASAVPQHPFLLRALYFVLVGWWFSGLWMAAAYLLVVSVIGLPFAFWMYGRVGAVTTLFISDTPSVASQAPRMAPRSLPKSPTRGQVSIGQMLSMTPSEFEIFTGNVLQANGFRDVHVSGGPRDLAADLIATDPQGRSAVIQCKRLAPGNRVGSPLLQSFIGMARLHHGAEVGVFVTTSSFTVDAKALAARHEIELIDGDELARLSSAL